jgi:hypothetical protein
VPHVKSWEPFYLTEVPDWPQAYTLYVLWLQGKGAQILTYKRGQNLAFTKNVGPVQGLLYLFYLTICCATNRKVAGSIQAGVIAIFH